MLAPHRVAYITAALLEGYELAKDQNMPEWLVRVEDAATGWQSEDNMFQNDVAHSSLYLCFVIELLICGDELDLPSQFSDFVNGIQDEASEVLQ